EEYLDKELKIRLLPNGVNIGTDKFFAVKDNLADVMVELIPAPTPGSLKIVTLPPDAIVYLDGVEIGKSPLTMPKVTPGNREIKVSIPNFDNLTKKVSVVSNKETVVELLLGGIMNFSSVPSDAQIYLDGKYLGQTPFKSDRLPIGSHQIRFAKDRYKDKNITAILERGQEMNINVRLLPQKGSLAISSDPTEAEVYLDGKLKGKTPLTIYGILIGKYSLKIIKSGYEEYNTTVDIDENNILWHFARLVKR
ncbi:MAG: PEGA domain-containing protein, partial [Candidatus Poribacteria bacterium]